MRKDAGKTACDRAKKNNGVVHIVSLTVNGPEQA